MSLIPPKQAAWSGAIANAGQVNQFHVTQPTYLGYNPSVPSSFGLDPFTQSSFTTQLIDQYTSVAQIITPTSAALAVGVSVLLYTTDTCWGDVSISITNVDGSSHPSSVKGQAIIPAMLMYYQALSGTTYVPTALGPTQAFYVPIYASLAASTQYAIVISSNLYQNPSTSPYQQGGYVVSSSGSSTYAYPGGTPQTAFNVPLVTASSGLTAGHLLSKDGGNTWFSDTNSSSLAVCCGFLVSGGNTIPPLPTTIAESASSSWTWVNYVWPTTWNPTSYTGSVPQINTITKVTQRAPQDQINYLAHGDSEFLDPIGNASLGRWTAQNASVTLSNSTFQGSSVMKLTNATTTGSTNLIAWTNNDSDANFVLTNSDPGNATNFTIAAIIVPATSATPLRDIYIGYSTIVGSLPTNPGPQWSGAMLEPSATLPNLYQFTFSWASDTSSICIPIISIAGTAAGESHLVLGVSVSLGNSVPNWQTSGLGIGNRRYTSYTSSNVLIEFQ